MPLTYYHRRIATANQVSVSNLSTLRALVSSPISALALMVRRVKQNEQRLIALSLNLLEGSSFVNLITCNHIEVYHGTWTSHDTTPFSSDMDNDHSISPTSLALSDDSDHSLEHGVTSLLESFAATDRRTIHQLVDPGKKLDNQVMIPPDSPLLKFPEYVDPFLHPLGEANDDSYPNDSHNMLWSLPNHVCEMGSPMRALRDGTVVHRVCVRDSTHESVTSVQDTGGFSSHNDTTIVADIERDYMSSVNTPIIHTAFEPVLERSPLGESSTMLSSSISPNHASSTHLDIKGDLLVSPHDTTPEIAFNTTILALPVHIEVLDSTMEAMESLPGSTTSALTVVAPSASTVDGVESESSEGEGWCHVAARNNAEPIQLIFPTLTVPNTGYKDYNDVRPRNEPVVYHDEMQPLQILAPPNSPTGHTGSTLPTEHMQDLARRNGTAPPREPAPKQQESRSEQTDHGNDDEEPYNGDAAPWYRARDHSQAQPVQAFTLPDSSFSNYLPERPGACGARTRPRTCKRRGPGSMLLLRTLDHTLRVLDVGLAAHDGLLADDGLGD